MAPARGIAQELACDPLFASCDRLELQRLAAAAETFEGRRGDRLVYQHQPFPYLGFVRRGVVGAAGIAEWQVHGGVRRMGMYESYGGSTFGEISILDGGEPLGEVAVMSARAACALIPADAAMELAYADAAFMQRLARRAALRCRSIAQRLLEIASRPVTERVAEVLLPFARPAPGLQPADPLLAEFVQRDLAAAAGCVKEAAARAIAELESARALRREHGRIRYLDRGALLRFTRAQLDGRHVSQRFPAARERERA